MAGIAIAGSCLFHAYASKPRLSVSIPAQFHKEFTPPLPAFISLNQQRHEVLPSKSLQTSLIRCFNTNKAASAESEENEKPNKGYFSRDTIADAAARIAPAVANLYAPKGGREEKGKMGSGTVIHEDGYILTCSHLFFDKTDVTYAADGKVTVHTQDVEKGHVVDAYVDLDIAIVKIDNPSSALSTAQVGSSSKLRPGDWAIAMGCPLSLQHTVTLGIISCVNRKSNELKRGGMAMEYLQTDCAINPGNSGGPLCNVDGELVGVNVETMKSDEASGVSFAVPVDFISAVIKPFKSCQMPVQPYFGWVMRNASRENFETLKQHYPTFPNAVGVFVQKKCHQFARKVPPILCMNLWFWEGALYGARPKFATVGYYIAKVIKGSPADCAGVQAGDVVVNFNKKRIRNMNEMLEVMGKKSGATVHVDVRRVGEDHEVPLTITFKQKDVATPRPRL